MPVEAAIRFVKVHSLSELDYSGAGPQWGTYLAGDGCGDGANWYAYCGNNPIKYVDPTGLGIDIPALVDSGMNELLGSEILNDPIHPSIKERFVGKGQALKLFWGGMKALDLQGFIKDKTTKTREELAQAGVSVEDAIAKLTKGNQLDYRNKMIDLLTEGIKVLSNEINAIAEEIEDLKKNNINDKNSKKINEKIRIREIFETGVEKANESLKMNMDKKKELEKK